MWVRYATLPNLDGLYGGKACLMQDGTALTKNRVPEEEEDKKHQGTEEFLEEKGFCQIQLCEMYSENPPAQMGHMPKCISMWTSWSKWGKCNKDCGDEGNRIRTRWIFFLQKQTDNFLLQKMCRCLRRDEGGKGLQASP